MITVIYLIWANKLCGHFQQETELANVSMDRMPRHLHFEAAYNGWEQDQQVWESNISGYNCTVVDKLLFMWNFASGKCMPWADQGMLWGR